MSGADFNDLLFEAEKLSSNIEGTNDLPKVDRSLRQVLEASNELYTRVTQTGAQDIQANLLLGSKGIDLPQIAQKLDSITAKRTFEPLDPIADNDIHSFLKNEIESCILNCIDQADKKTINDIEIRCWNDVNNYWKQEKRKILNAMIGPSGNFIDIRKTEMFQPIEMKTTNNFNLNFEEQVYYSVISEYNKALIRGANRTSLVSSLSVAAEEFKDTKVNDMWDMVKYMLDLPPFPKGEDALAYRDSKQVKTAMVEQAKKYLEERYKVYMGNIVNENLMHAKRGGVPGTYSLVRSFVGLRLPGGYLGLQDGAIDDRPLWPMIYYCLRSGDLPAALYCLQKAGAQFDDLSSIIDDKIHNRDVRKKEQAIRFQYRRNVRNSSDPFKRIVYCVLGCCDINDEHTEVAKTTDDYLWLKLSQVRDEKETEEHLNYSDLQTTILEEYGESHYEAHKQPHLYFQVLFLTGLYESAIEFLARTERYRVHAVHIAIVINELFMLGGSSSVEAPLISVDVADPSPLRRLNMARLIMIYVKRFELTNVLEALHYYFMLRHLKVGQNNLFMVSICDLAQETKSYELLFGKIQTNGIRSLGLVDQFIMANMTIEKLCEMVAKQLSKKGIYEEAVKVYDLADNQEEVLALMSVLLSQVVGQQTKSGSQRERLHQLAEEIATRYMLGGLKCTAPVVQTFNTLRELMVFFDLYYSKQYIPAMEILRDTRLVPFHKVEVDDRVGNFKRLAPEITQNLPDVLLAIMTILYEQYKSIKSNVSLGKFEESTLKQLSFIRDQAKAITNFAGTVPYRMPGDTNSRLVQMEILMH